MRIREKSLVWRDLDTTDYKLWFGFDLVKRNHSADSQQETAVARENDHSVTQLSLFFIPSQKFRISTASTRGGLLYFKVNLYFWIFIEIVATAGKTIWDMCGSHWHINT